MMESVSKTGASIARGRGRLLAFARSSNQACGNNGAAGRRRHRDRRAGATRFTVILRQLRKRHVQHSASGCVLVRCQRPNSRYRAVNQQRHRRDRMKRDVNWWLYTDPAGSWRNIGDLLARVRQQGVDVFADARLPDAHGAVWMQPRSPGVARQRIRCVTQSGTSSTLFDTRSVSSTGRTLRTSRWNTACSF